jgi:hypothetical protein
MRLCDATVAIVFCECGRNVYHERWFGCEWVFMFENSKAMGRGRAVKDRRTITMIAQDKVKTRRAHTHTHTHTHIHT